MITCQVCGVKFILDDDFYSHRHQPSRFEEYWYDVRTGQRVNDPQSRTIRDSLQPEVSAKQT